MRRSLKIAPLAIAALVIVFQFFSSEKVTNPVTGKKSHVAMSSQQEAALGLESYREVLSNSQVVQSGPEVEQVVRVVKRLAPATGAAAQDFDWQVSVVRSDQANAFCLPGGKIVVYTGILPITQTDAGLATVLGHEMAHATSRHGSQRLFQQSIAQIAMTGASWSLSDYDPQKRGAIMAALGAGAQYGVLLPFSRQHETEADQIGLLYMARAGYDPHESITFWERMSRAGGSQPPEFMSTHPSHGTRIERLQQLMPKAEEEYAKAKGQRSN
jgi:predicted Zn-dependent protease